MELYIGDLIRSTSGMSAEVFGAYFRLLLHQWEHGSIPKRSDERQLVCGVIAERWDAVWARISERFEPLDDEGRLGHPRMAKERPAAIARSARENDLRLKRQASGRLGGLAKAKQKPSKCSSKTLASASAEVKKAKQATKPVLVDVAQIDLVVFHYCSYHSKAKPGKKDRDLIAARMREGYSAADLMVAIDGCHVSPFHCGENDRGKKYQSLELIVRDSKHVAEFLELWEQRDDFVMTAKERKGARAAQQYLLRRDGSQK